MRSVLTIALVMIITGASSIGCSPPKVGVGNFVDSPALGAVLRVDEATPPRPKSERQRKIDAIEGITVPGVEIVPAQQPKRDIPVPDVTGEDDVGAAVSTLRKGQAAPFSGTLLSPAAVAKIIADLESVDARVAAEVKLALEKQKAEYELQLREVQIDLEGEKERREVQVRLRDEHIGDLNEALADAQSAPVWLYITGGALGGVLLTVVGALVVGQTNK